jgi:hypothetical protein
MGIKLKTVDGQEQVLDPACGGRKFYFDKNNPIVLFGDIRDESYVQCDYRTLDVHPDQKMDFRSLPFKDNSFYLVMFDPPHLYRTDAPEIEQRTTI